MHGVSHRVCPVAQRQLLWLRHAHALVSMHHLHGLQAQLVARRVGDRAAHAHAPARAQQMGERIYYEFAAFGDVGSVVAHC